jgi:lauroyl/myristoyl acyltransferase
MVKKLTFWFVSGLEWMGFYLMRFGERVLPQSVLSFLLWPPAVVWALTELHRPRKLLASWHRFPGEWRPGRARLLLRQSLGLTHARFVYLWPDHLPDQRWLTRCRFEGHCDLAQLQRADRRIIFVSLHFGPFETLPFWLRANGIVITALIGPRRGRRQWLSDRQYALTPPANVSLILPVSEIHLIRKVLGDGRRLLVWMDVDRGKQIQVPFENHLFRMATGPIRLAMMTEAELIPCLIVETRPWRFVIHFGTPVPGRYLGSSANLKPAAAHLLKEFLPIVSRYPSQSGYRLASCITPMNADEGATRRHSEVTHPSSRENLVVPPGLGDQE